MDDGVVLRRRPAWVLAYAFIAAVPAAALLFLLASGVITAGAWLWVVAIVLLLEPVAIVALQLRRRLRIDAAGLMTVDGLLGRTRLDLAALERVETSPDVPLPTGAAPSAGGPWRTPQLVLLDAHGQRLQTPLSDHWVPPQPLFDRVLDAADRSTAAVSENARQGLEYLAGRSGRR
jgi:hypothetical protein